MKDNYSLHGGSSFFSSIQMLSRDTMQLKVWPSYSIKENSLVLFSLQSMPDPILKPKHLVLTSHGLLNFSCLGRLPLAPSSAKRAQLYRANWVRSQRRMANNSNEEFMVAKVAGRLAVDVKQVTERNVKLRSYSFAEVCQEYFGHPKETIEPPTLVKVVPFLLLPYLSH